jgi:predicted ATP-binding protein involved in virulence
LAMKIIKIEVKKLFGVFNHEIPLNTKDHITIIHGPNGYGKTILLTLVNAIFNSQYHKISAIPFSELVLDFDTKNFFSLKKDTNSADLERKKVKNGKQLIFELSSPRGKPKVYTPVSINRQNLPFPISYIERAIPGIERVSSTTWLYHQTEEELSLEEVLDRFAFRLPSSTSNLRIKGEPAWFKEIKESIDIHFIETQRLLRVSYSKIKYDYEKHPSMVPVVNNYSIEIAEAIQSKLAEYGSISQSLDRTFPTRLIKQKRSNESTREELKMELNELESKRSRLIAAGFLEKEKEIDFKDLQKIDESNINVLSVYIDDVKQKLSVFDELTEKIDLLIKIINSRFLHKRLSISKTDGFIFKTPEGKIIPTTSLSSGEQHELVLLYEMLFKVKPNSLILIDEPEISLHVVWQQEFLKDLQEITRLVGFDVLIATHSPQIINDRWDLTVELKGPKQ